MNSEQKVAIITGVTGQDGSYLAEFLLNKGYRVIGLVRRSSVDNHCNRVSHLLSNTSFELIPGDVTDANNMLNIISEIHPDELYNLAAQSYVQSSFTQPSFTFEVNAIGVLNLLEAVRMCSPYTRFYQASTSEMFGKNCSVFDHDKGVVHHYDIITAPQHILLFQNEDTPFSPQSPYAIAKVAAHHLVRLYRDAYKLHASCGILFNHESERRGEEFVTRKITKWIGQFKYWLTHICPKDATLSFSSSGSNLYAFDKDYKNYTFPKLRLGNLFARRDWGHAEDYIKAMWMILQNDNPDDYVVSTQVTHSVKEFLLEAFYAAGLCDIAFSHCIIQDEAFVRPAEVDYLLGNSEKIRNRLGWKPEVSFNELVRRMVNYDINLAIRQFSDEKKNTT